VPMLAVEPQQLAEQHQRLAAGEPKAEKPLL
jgi:hypothetical protein